MKKIINTVTLISTALLGAHANAYEGGDILVRAGFGIVAPNSDSDGVAIPALDIPPIPGTSVEADNETQLGLTATYMLSSTFGIELLAATPFDHNITADLSAAGIPGVGTVPVAGITQLPPTLSAVWYPFGSKEALKPYVGAGLNYTLFFDEDVDPALEALAGELAGAGGPLPLDLDLDDSFGLALQAGLDYQLNAKWSLNASVRWMDIGTEADITSPGIGTVISVDNVDIDPWVYQLNIGYTF